MINSAILQLHYKRFYNQLASSQYADKLELFEATCTDAATEGEYALKECLHTWMSDFNDGFQSFDELVENFETDKPKLPNGWKQYLITIDNNGDLVAVEKLMN